MSAILGPIRAARARRFHYDPDFARAHVLSFGFGFDESDVGALGVRF